MRLQHILFIAFALAATLMTGAAKRLTAAEAPLVLEKTIPLTGISGRIDHLALDLSGGRLFVAELGNNSVDIIDLHTDKVIRRIEGLKEPQGIAYLADQGLLAVASAGDGTVRFFRADDFSAQGSVDLKEDADNIRIGPSTGQIAVGYGNGGIAIIDPASRSELADIRLADHPESFQIDADGNRAFVNVPEAHHIAVLDLNARKQIATWPTMGLRSNFPMALAGSAGPVAVVFRGPPKLALFDIGTGAISARLATCDDADDVFFDEKRERIYISCGEGVVDVVQRRSDGLTSIARVPTASGARTALFVPALDRLFVAARAGPGSSAAILVLRPTS